MMPPKMLMSRGLVVTSKPGSRSVSTLLSTIIKQEYRVNFFPINLKLTMAGMALRIRLIREKGRSTCKKVEKML